MPYTLNKVNISNFVIAIVLITIIATVLGCIDYLTGEISLDVVYIVCISVVTWYTNIYLGIFCVLEIMLARTTADYYDHVKIGSHLYEWNSLNFLIIYLVICVLVTLIKKALSK